MKAAFQQAAQTETSGAPFPQIQRVISSLLDRLFYSTGDETHLAARLIILFTTLEPIRINALDLLARQSWNAVQSDSGASLKSTRTAAIWAALFRLVPHEMSHACLSAGMTVRPNETQHQAWIEFLKAVSHIIGRSVGEIIREQVPDLP